MFKPKDGEWVPLKLIRWTAYGCVEGTTVKQSGASHAPPVITSKHPEWENWVRIGEVTKIGACPSDPGCKDWKPRKCEWTWEALFHLMASVWFSWLYYCKQGAVAGIPLCLQLAGMKKIPFQSRHRSVFVTLIRICMFIFRIGVTSL